ncbi:hypothetical protein F5877DRAFT_73170 [Lentinula edodes]|nr:hypothetical protein F5877DRAFT_73170 [Lentinula edodes]
MFSLSAPSLTTSLTPWPRPYNAEIKRLKAECPWAQIETKLELREKEIVKEAKKQELEQSIWRSIERDAKLMGTKSLLDAAETEEEGGAESGQGQKTEISKRSQRVCPFPQAENETNFHFYFGDEWRKTKWNHLVVRYMNQAHISGDLSNAVIEAYIWERDPTQFVAYRRFTYDETTKLGFGLSQRKRSALQAKGSSSSKVKASEFRKSLPSKKITAFKGKCRRSSKSRDEESLPFKRARGYSPPVDAATAKSPSFLFLLSIAAVAGPLYIVSVQNFDVLFANCLAFFTYLHPSLRRNLDFLWSQRHKLFPTLVFTRVSLDRYWIALSIE